jgi:RTX calcium-binding nonapeptide repeat (4 copies)
MELEIMFADGSTWTPGSSVTQPFTENLLSDGGNDTLVGGAGATTMTGGAGSDLMVAGTGTNTMQGGAGTETYEFGPDFGNTAIQACTAEQGANTIQFLAGIDSSQVSFTDSGSNLVITVTASDGDTSTITLDNHFVDGSPVLNDVSELTFADGTIVTMAQINQQFGTSESDSDTKVSTGALVAEPAATSPTTATDKSKATSSADLSDVPKLVMQAGSSIAGNLATPGKNTLTSRGSNGYTPTIGGSNQNASSNDAPTAASNVQPSANGNESQQSSILVGNPDLNDGMTIASDPGNSGNTAVPNDPIDGDPDDATIWAPENTSGSGGSQVAGAAPRGNDTLIGQATSSAPQGRGTRLGRTANAANDMIKALSAQGNVQDLGKAADKSQTAPVQLQDGTLWSLSTLDRTMAALSPEAVQSARAAAGNSAFGSADLAHAQLVEAMASFSPEASAESSLPPTGSEAYAITVAAQMH